MNNDQQKREELFEKLMQANKRIEAQQKTIDVLTQKAMDKQLNRDSSFALLEENSALQDVVNRKVVELEEQNQKLEEAHSALQHAQDELLQAQKLESIGRLAAGVAHEINTPIQYITDNINFVKDSIEPIQKLHSLFKQMSEKPFGKCKECLHMKEARKALDELKLDRTLEEIPEALDDTIEGAMRVSKIVMAMKEFSHPGSQDRTLTDVNQALQTTISVARNEWKYSCKVDFIPNVDLPKAPLYGGEFNQCMLNLIINAAHAIEENLKAKGTFEQEMGVIKIRTQFDEENLIIRIQDSGTGIPSEIIDQIYDPFFTTKPPGKGTGQGLTFVYNNIVKKHKGTINIETTLGQGTTFIITLPLKPNNDEK